MQIPVDYVVGLEWGSLVAALYANEGSVHDLQWKIYKMNASVLPEKKFFWPLHLQVKISMSRSINWPKPSYWKNR